MLEAFEWNLPCLELFFFFIFGLLFPCELFFIFGLIFPFELFFIFGLELFFLLDSLVREE